MIAGTSHKKKSKPGCINFAKYLGTSTWVPKFQIAVPVPVNRKSMNPGGYIRFGSVIAGYGPTPICALDTPPTCIGVHSLAKHSMSECEAALMHAINN